MVAFLITHVKNPDEDDLGKLKGVLKYLKGTRNLELNLTGDQVGLMTWYAGASFTVHEDCKGHTGGLMTFGHGYKFLMKTETGSRSSTEAELVGVDDALHGHSILWKDKNIKLRKMN